MMDEPQSGEYSGHFGDLSGQPQRPSDYSPEADSCVAKISDILNVISHSPYSDPRLSPQDSPQEDHKVTVPRLRLKESTVAQLKSKSTESINSVGTVIRHETPKRPPCARPRPPSPYRNSRRPSSAKPSRSSGNQSVKDEIEVISHLTAQDAIRSLYTLVNSKVRTIGVYQLPEKDRADVQNFFQEQKRKFQNELKADLFEKTLTRHDLHKMEIARRENERSDKKREEISDRKQMEEIKRKKQSLRLRRESVDSVQKGKVESMFHKLEQQRRSEESAQRRDEKEVFKTEKQLILENIKNFYQDQVRRLREKIEENRFTKQIVETARKKELLCAERERKAQRKRQLAEVSHLLDRRSTELERELADKKFEEEILSIYRRSK